ncbi:MAG: class I SAM-dependent methyltransferase [Thermoplasmata archaeon]
MPPDLPAATMAPTRTSAPPARSRLRLTGHARKNRANWNRTAEEYEHLHESEIGPGRAMAWGVWRVPESKLRLLGAIRGKDILELGCGAAHWSVALALRGARMTALDVAPTRLAQARRSMDKAKVNFPLIEASAESLPFPARSFDTVFCDWGAMTFVDPCRSVPEVARVLRPGGIFAFSNSSPFRSVAHDRVRDQISRTLLYDYFGLHRIEFPENEVDFQLPFGEWVRLFRENRLVVDALIEPRPPPGATSSYLSPREVAWARRWPFEAIWKTHRTPGRISGRPRRK